MYEQRTGEYIEWFYNDADFGNGDEIQEGVFDVSASVEIISQAIPTSSLRTGSGVSSITYNTPDTHIYDGEQIHFAYLPAKLRFRDTTSTLRHVHNKTPKITRKLQKENDATSKMRSLQEVEDDNTAVPTFSPTISIPPAVAGATESPVVDVLPPTISPSRASVSNPPITTDSELATLNDGCPPGEVYLGVNLSIEISFRLSTPSITLDEILAAPFSQQVYRETYRLDFLKEDDPLGFFTDLTCTSELLFVNVEEQFPTEAPTQSPTFSPTEAPTLNPICELRPYEVSESFQNWV